MIKNQWYAVEFGHVVGESPHHVDLMGQQLVLWREAGGTIHAQSDICIHRGGSLAGGKVRNGCIECPYHGWQYDADGRCTRIPANRDGMPIPKKARIDTYPAVERYGYVFVFLGDLSEAERPAMPYVDELDQTAVAQASGFRAITGEFVWAANYERVLENAVDIAHAPFVHAGSFGNPDSPVVEDYDVVEITHDGQIVGNVSTVHLDPPTPSGIWKFISRRSSERPPIRTRTGIYFPNLTMLEVNLPLGVMRIFTAVVPISATHSVSKWTMMRSFFTGKWADRDSRRRTDKIFLEDQPTVEGQRPELVPVDLASELHVRSDANQIAYRRWRQAGLDRGWGMPDQEPGDGAHGAVRVVASPARREEPDLAAAWVLKELELDERAADEALRSARPFVSGPFESGAR
ncbi:MAG TPA: aromatic ring-hydroxylating dioxygenase subunit alpha [Microthrixaceae bacterium]|nr:aromatic ring-hydroxylating dioxygenase subunit alpha [Microthrixaceae bacterium]